MAIVVDLKDHRVAGTQILLSQSSEDSLRVIKEFCIGLMLVASVSE